MSNLQINNTNSFSFGENHKSSNMNVQSVVMNAQIDNPNGQVQNNINNNPESDLAIIFKSVAQVMQQYLAKKSLQKSESSQQINKIQNNFQMEPINSSINKNQINNEPFQGLKNIMMNQLFKLYSSPNQNRPAKNPPKVQESQISNNLPKSQKQNNIQINNLNQKENNNNESFNQSEETSIHDEINTDLKELININKLQNLIMLISNEDQKEKMRSQDLLIKELIESHKEQKAILSELIKTNKEQKAILSELIKSNKNQQIFNNKVFESIEHALALINNNQKSNTGGGWWKKKVEPGEKIIDRKEYY